MTPECDHFDCACPPFVLDGRVSSTEWTAYVMRMGLGVPPELQDVADKLADEADAALVAERALHNPWDASCRRHITGEASREGAVCSACHPLR